VLPIQIETETKELSGYFSNPESGNSLTFKIQPIKFEKFEIPTYFHVRMTWTEGFWIQYSYEVNLSEEQTKNIANQFLRKECLWFDGKKVDSKNITELRIYKTNFFNSYTSIYWHNAFPAGYTGDFGGTDVTRQFITQAPTAYQTEIQRLASEMLQSCKNLSLDDNWVLATLALQLQEVAIVFYSKKLKIDLSKQNVERILGKKIEDDYLPFGLMYDALTKEVERLCKVQMPMLAKSFRGMRTEVLHSGYNPKEEETRTIITFTDGLLKKLESIKVQ
jgi:hypothetical protein